MIADSIEMAFLQDNARTEEEDYIIENFIATDKFWQLFCPKHQILYGSRGSGKTAITKMASFPFLKGFNHPEAKKIVENLEYIGIFVNTDIRFVGSLKNKLWTNEFLAEKYFVWKFNINCLKSIIVTIDSVLGFIYGNNTNRFHIEKLFINEITSILFKETPNLRLVELTDYISDYEFKVRDTINNEFLLGQKNFTALSDSFSTEILEPIQFVIRSISKQVKALTNTKWLLFVDEAEFLTSDQHIILNSFMRTNPDKIFIKMATLPYYHHTLDTNLGVHLQPDDDFQYIYLDANPIYDLNSKSRQIYSFARKLFQKRIENYINSNNFEISNNEKRSFYDLDIVLGESPFERFKRLPSDLTIAIDQITPYLDENTTLRAERLITNRAKFGNEIWRKVTGIICLIDSQRQASGNKQMSCYSGADTIIRCTDGVPRRMINLYQDISREVVKFLHSNQRTDVSGFSSKNPILTGKAQTRILKSFSEKRFIQSISVPGIGPKLRDFLEGIGEYMSHQLHKEKISTDVIGSFRLDSETSEEYWEMVRCGVAFGFIFPNVTDRQPDRLVEKKGAFRLSFALCPKFNTFPRKGTARNLQGMLRARKRNLNQKATDRKKEIQGIFEF